MKTDSFSSGRSPAWYAALAGALGIWLGFPNDFINLPLLAFLWPLSLVWLGLAQKRPVKAFLLGWLTTWAGFTAALYWLSLPVHQVGGLPLPLAACCSLLIAALLATQGGAFCLGIFFLRHAQGACLAILASLLWYLLEYAWAMALQFPWLPLAGALAPMPVMIQGANMFGANFWMAGWLCAILLCCPARDRPYGLSGRMIAGAILLAAMLAYGIWRLDEAPRDCNINLESKLDAIFVEGNIDQNQKWLPSFQRKTLELYINLTDKAVEATVGRDLERTLVIWPETALPFFFETSPGFSQELRKAVRGWKSPLLFGAPGVGAEINGKRTIFNRAFFLDPNGQTLGYYDKMQLVPFGEYTPKWLNFDFLSELLQGVGIYEQGVNAEPLRYNNLALGMLICYEGIFPQLAQERVDAGANILVDISNDGWFDLSPAPRQHLYLTLLRCVEQNRWLLRSTNTGISAIVDNLGQIRLKGPQFETGFIKGQAELLTKKSVYHHIASQLPLCALFLFGILAAYAHWIYLKKRIK